jgi:Rps23 Pro-64 3,4-dihydroxylase Tpa1-like proline 4-hydroxylase
MIDLSLAPKLKTLYEKNYPFPYIVIDNFLPEHLLKVCKEEIHKHDVWHSDSVDFTKEFQQNKLYYPQFDTDMVEFRTKLPITSFVMEYLNSTEFIKFLEELTGHPKLFRDPVLMGGGVHRIKKGGKLSVHVDYNEHPYSGKKRILNLLIYLNENWEKEWEGNLELWTVNPPKKFIDIEPIFNRAVIFDIEDAPHGHPVPLNTPQDVDRYSLALYYFIDEPPEEDKKHRVIFYRDNLIGAGTPSNDLFK